MWPRVPAVGGERDVPEPDPIARDYLLLALRLDQRIPGLVDGFFGPASLKAQVDLEPLRAPARLVADAVDLLRRVDVELADPERREWLALQVRALETHAETLAGIERPYAELVERCFAVAPAAHGDAVFVAARAELEDLLPGREPLVDRLAAWDAGLVVPLDRLGPIVDWLVAELRRRAEPVFGLPPGESLRVSLVRDQPWSGYNWYDGGLRSRVDLNVDLPIRAPELLATVAHETYAGHHLEHAWKEAELVERRAQLEASILVINAPECFLSEGLAEVGRPLLLGADAEAELLAELLARAALPLGSDGARATRRRGRQSPSVRRAHGSGPQTSTRRCCSTPKGGRVLRSRTGSPGRRCSPRSERPRSSSSSSIRCGAPTCSSTRRAQRSSSAGSGRFRAAIVRPAIGGSSSSRSPRPRSSVSWPPADQPVAGSASSERTRIVRSAPSPS